MITCDQSDYLEIACLYRIPIALNWPDGRRVEGIPLDTGYNEQREECLLMRRGEDFLMAKAQYLRRDTAEEITLGMTRGKRKSLRRAGKQYTRRFNKNTIQQLN